jgi:L-threonate 2-dehydrogenase
MNDTSSAAGTAAEDQSTRPRVGLVGLGIMGLSYARNLRQAGCEIVGFDIAPAPLAALREIGGHVAASPADVAARSNIVITALTRPEILTEVCLGSQGLVAGSQTGTVFIEMSTLPVPAKEACRDALEAADAVMLDCPVSGTGAQAFTGQLDVYASGDADAVDRIKPVLALFTRRVHYTGPFGTGMKLKCIANLLVTIHNLASAEALLLAERAGLDLQLVLNVLRTGAANSRILELRGPMMASGQYEPVTAKMDVHVKDIMLILGFARDVQSPTPLLSASLPFYIAGLAEGRSAEDTASLFKVLGGGSAKPSTGAQGQT